MTARLNCAALRLVCTAAALGVALAGMSISPSRADAQLRPLDPLPWNLFDGATHLTARAGLSRFAEQNASLAGTTGTLTDIGDFAASWRSGRIAIEIGGTVLRSFQDAERFTTAHPTVIDGGPRRSDSGNYRIGTLVRLTPIDWPALLLLRFGTSLPNSDNTVGIERDRTDFYALLGAGVQQGPLSVGTEAGIGINGTHNLEYEQADALLYALTWDYALRALTLHGVFLGQRSGFDGWVQRGNESLSELRLGVSAGTGARFRVQVLHVRGLAEFSPSSGWMVSASTSR